MNEKECPNRVACMVGIQMLILEDGATSWQTNRGPKVASSRNILPPVQKSREF
jgi:hypothetical protein